jgi:hypothetical protein
MVEFECDSLVFHFNKKHLQDATVPMWVIKAKGETYYINHVTADVSWTTKETPDNAHTKGSLKFRNCRCLIDDNNDATITKPDPNNPIVEETKPNRIMITGHDPKILEGIEHTKLQYITGICSTGYMICDLLHESDLTLLILKFRNSFRVLQENEVYYQRYGKEDTYSLDDIDEWDEEDQEWVPKSGLKKRFVSLFKAMIRKLRSSILQDDQQW